MSQQQTQIKDISHSIGDINFHLPILLDSEKRVRMRMVGDVFTVSFEDRVIRLAVVPQNLCNGCFFKQYHCNLLECVRLFGECSASRRWDNTSVIFKEIQQIEEA